MTVFRGMLRAGLPVLAQALAFLAGMGLAAWQERRRERPRIR